MTNIKEADIGITQSYKEELAQKLQSVFAEREALTHQIKASQWNIQGARASELTQLLSVIAPEAPAPTTQAYQTPHQTIQAFPPSNQIAERISLIGSQVPASYEDLSEYSRIERPPQTTEVHQQAEALAKSAEQFCQTARQAITIAIKASDEVTKQALTQQLKPAEQLATQLRRFK